MASSNAADTYETQNDQQLDALHSKIRTLRGVTSDIYDDVERQHTTLDETGNIFSSFTGSLSQSSRRAAHALGSSAKLKQYRLLLFIVGAIIGFWVSWNILKWFWPRSGQ